MENQSPTPAERALYEVIYIRDASRLQLLSDTVVSQPEIGEYVRELSVDLRMCWGGISENTRQSMCDRLYKILNATTKLRLLSLDLEQHDDSFRNSGPEDFAAGGPNSGYHNFYERVADRIRNDLLPGAQARTFLPEVKEFRFSSGEEHHMYCAFFALPKLNCIVSLRDAGAWLMILNPARVIGRRFFNIKELSLESSALIPSEFNIFTWPFPNLKNFNVRNKRLFSGGPTGAALAGQNLSATLGRMGNLEKLGLDNFPTHLGPLNGITSLGGMPHLTELRLGIHHLMCYGGQNGSRPLAPSSLPPALRHLQIYTCFKCWDTWARRLSWDVGPQAFPEQVMLSTLGFISDLAQYVSVGQGLPGLETVRLYSREGWWLHSGADRWTVRHFEEENGQDWPVGYLDICCKISRFGDRGIHFRAYETNEPDC